MCFLSHPYYQLEDNQFLCITLRQDVPDSNNITKVKQGSPRNQLYMCVLLGSNISQYCDACTESTVCLCTSSQVLYLVYKYFKTINDRNAVVKVIPETHGQIDLNLFC